MIFFLSIFAFFMATGITALLLHPSGRFHLLDHPNDRSLHSIATPRGGGIAIISSVLISAALILLLLNKSNYILWICSICLFISVVSFLDDRHNVHAIYRFIVHILAASILVYAEFTISTSLLPGNILVPSGYGAVLLTILFVVWMLNLYNFMDGMDGFAAGMTVIGFSSMAYFGWIANDIMFVAFNLSIACAAAGFLLFNFPPARIFMGDVGSSSLGFLAASCILWGSHEQIFPFWVAMLIFSPFIVDATVTLVSRLLRREKIWKAHKSHYYQRLVLLGWGHRKTVYWEYGIMLLSSISAIIVTRLQAQHEKYVLFIWLVLYVLIMLGIARLERHKR